MCKIKLRINLKFYIKVILKGNNSFCKKCINLECCFLFKVGFL